MILTVICSLDRSEAVKRTSVLFGENRDLSAAFNAFWRSRLGTKEAYSCEDNKKRKSIQQSNSQGPDRVEGRWLKRIKCEEDFSLQNCAGELDHVICTVCKSLFPFEEEFREIFREGGMPACPKCVEDSGVKAAAGIPPLSVGALEPHFVQEADSLQPIRPKAYARRRPVSSIIEPARTRAGEMEGGDTGNGTIPLFPMLELPIRRLINHDQDTNLDIYQG